MDRFVIRGGHKLSGTVTISGAKNASLPLMVACLLTGEDVELTNVPRLRDVSTMMAVIKAIGVKVDWTGPNSMKINASGDLHFEAPYDLIKTMRASFLVLGPMLARSGKARVALPGGCAIGSRPVDLHLKGFEKLGAKITLGHGYVEAKASKLVGATIYLDFPSVGATENLMMAAAHAQGTTVIRNAAREPEIDDLATILMNMGVSVEGAGTDEIIVKGTKKFHGTKHEVIPDRIEAGTFMIAAAITKGKIKIKSARFDHLEALIAKLEQAGVTFLKEKDDIKVEMDERPKPLSIKSLPYPGLPTDLQPQMMALLSLGRGTSDVTETVFENRFMHVPELKRMGADLQMNDRTVIVNGVKELSGAPVMASDLRNGAALILAALAAKGKTELQRVYHVDRGYEGIEKKLTGLGAKIERLSEGGAAAKAE
jgi:UDP-N-acetylglucosamine 1-carboxyvinyltransferase